MHRAGYALCLVLVGIASTGCLTEDVPPTATTVPVPTIARPPLASPTLSPASVAAPSPSPSVESQTYTVQSGDTLTSIAARFYGDSSQWRMIFEANRDRMTSAEALQVGMQLRIPPRTQS